MSHLRFDRKSVSLIALILFSAFACKKTDPSTTAAADAALETDARFTLLPPEQTGVHFSNRFTETYDVNIFTYENLYNGCGVAAGDVNGDGLPDLYFSASFGPNKLYINLGDMKFMDVSEKSGVAAPTGFKTGVLMGDINGDGRTDIYSCRTGLNDRTQMNDHVFIHIRNEEVNGVQVPIFEDQAAKLGLEDNHNTNHACLIDYDRDGDLDVFLLNHRTNFKESTRMRLKQGDDGQVTRIVSPETPYESNQLYRNDRGRFTDVTENAGLVSSAFGLSVTPVDLNQDGWMDLYVANDYIEPDYYYLNNRNGTFTDLYTYTLRHSCQNSMGADVTDINNDGLPDIFVLDMKAETPTRYKELMNVMQFDRYNLLVQYGYGRQIGRNVLQINNGNGGYSEIAQYSGVAATDWSWAPLIGDYNHDGLKDIYITNGYLKDVLNLDYTNYFRDSISKSGGISPDRYPEIQDFLKHLPEYKATNYLFIQGSDLQFLHANASAGMQLPSYSNGAAYADLDLDGDLDIIVNNIQDPAFIYRNDISGKSWLEIKVTYDNPNHMGLGTQAEVYAGDLYQHQAVNINRGFYSTSEPILHFGLNQIQQIDSIILTWPSGQQEIMKAVPANQRLEWKKGSGQVYTRKPKAEPAAMFKAIPTGINWWHTENEFVDFKREKLLPYMMSAEGPCISIGDLNGDGLDDMYTGNASGYPGGCWAQNTNGTFQAIPNPVFEQDKLYEDCASVLFDVDQDKDLDLMVVSGGNAAALNADDYLTRFYRNDGKGQFARVVDFPIIRTNASCIVLHDYDGDQDPDILIGGRSAPGLFPTAARSYLLRNDQGRFADVTKEVIPALENLGMITDIQIADLDGDGSAEVVMAGEWMPIRIFTMKNGKYEDATASYGMEKTNGWWKGITLDDVDGDGDTDIVAGNMGLNHRLQASVQAPLTLVTKDFDGNGSLDPIMCYSVSGELHPFAQRDMIIGQLPMLKKKFLRYSPYAKCTLEEVFTPEQLKGASRHFTYTFQTTLYLNEGKRFSPATLPSQVQWSPIYSILVEDFNQDGRKDLLMAGNFKFAETETGEMDAGNGVLLLQQPDGSFEFVPNRQHGFWAQYEVRELHFIQLANGRKGILTANNQGPMELHQIQSTNSSPTAF